MPTWQKMYLIKSRLNKWRIDLSTIDFIYVNLWPQEDPTYAPLINIRAFCIAFDRPARRTTSPQYNYQDNPDATFNNFITTPS